MIDFSSFHLNLLLGDLCWDLVWCLLVVSFMFVLEAVR